MFEGSVFTGDISNWDTRAVEDMQATFDASAFNGDVSNWNVSNLAQASRMFAYSAFNGDLSLWTPKNTLGTAEMFLGCPFQGDLSHWELCTQGLDRMVDPSFRGKLPSVFRSVERTVAQVYAALLGGPVELSAYLRSTPFSGPHFDILMDATKKPAWADRSDYVWVQKQKHWANTLGLSTSELRAHCLSTRNAASASISMQELDGLTLFSD